MFRNKMASQHSFAMIPRSDIPRSRYMLEQNRKQTFDGGDLVPIYCEEILPGDHFKGSSTIYARFATPITAVLDNAEFETFFFFVSNRIVWDNWEEFISGGNFTVPRIISVCIVDGCFERFSLDSLRKRCSAISCSFSGPCEFVFHPGCCACRS